MSTAVVGGHIEGVQVGTGGNVTALSWSVAIAGALAATAVTFIFLSLGSGVGLAIASPAGPSAGTLTIAGAIWLVVAQTVGYAVGGFIAGRLRIRTHIPGHETHFRDGTHGFMAWVIGVALTSVLVFMIGAFSATTAANVASSIGAGAMRSASMVSPTQSPGAATPISQDAMSYFVDALFRTTPVQPTQPPAPSAPAATPAPAPAAAAATTPSRAAGPDPASSPAGETPPSMALYGGVPGARDLGFGDLPRVEASRILFSGVSEGALSENDRTYLARLVAARTGIPEEDAQKRVTEIQGRVMERVRDTAESARRAGAYVSFWSFMALLFGAVAAVGGGVFGGKHRDQV
jgi:hypothetical protein